MTTTYLDSEIQGQSELVLCIEERDKKSNYSSIDTRLFVIWSDSKDSYLIWGKRQDINNHTFVPYTFRVETISELYDFIDLVIGKTYSSTIYNYNNIESGKKYYLTYEFLEKYMDRRYEVVAYDNVKKKNSYKFLATNLNLLKSVYNVKEYENVDYEE